MNTVPEIVVAALHPDLARTEPDPEIHALIHDSGGSGGEPGTPDGSRGPAAAGGHLSGDLAVGHARTSNRMHELIGKAALHSGVAILAAPDIAPNPERGSHVERAHYGLTWSKQVDMTLWSAAGVKAYKAVLPRDTPLIWR
jgi:DNA-binding transcriptional LysR family regulator